jgi:hypothetical protein
MDGYHYRFSEGRVGRAQAARLLASKRHTTNPSLHGMAWHGMAWRVTIPVHGGPALYEHVVPDEHRQRQRKLQ